MELEFHQVDLRYESLRTRSAAREARLLASLAETGQQVPVVVTIGEHGRHVLVDGYKRVRALRRLGRDTVRAMVWDLGEAEALLLERLMRSGDGAGALEEGWLLAELRDRFGMTVEELGKRFDRSASWVSRRLGLVGELPREIQEQVQEVTRDLLERFKAWQHAWRDEEGKGLAVLSQVGRLIVIRAFFKWLARNNLILFNPASEVDYPKVGFRLPKVVFTPAEVEQVLARPDVDDPLGLRDRAILETFYSTGLRRMEVANLDLSDLDEVRGTVLVRQGKGDKDRVVPIGERALAWIAKYLADGRPALVRDGTESALFVSRFGTRLTGSGLTKMASGCVRKASLGKAASCHVFRHSAATAMLENGADIRFIQEMLGHARLTSTQVYTRVSIAKLKAVHTATHPAALLEGRPEADGGRGDEPAETDEDGERAQEGPMARGSEGH